MGNGLEMRCRTHEEWIQNQWDGCVDDKQHFDCAVFRPGPVCDVLDSCVAAGRAVDGDQDFHKSSSIRLSGNAALSRVRSSGSVPFDEHSSSVPFGRDAPSAIPNERSRADLHFMTIGGHCDSSKRVNTPSARAITRDSGPPRVEAGSPLRGNTRSPQVISRWFKLARRPTLAFAEIRRERGANRRHSNELISERTRDEPQGLSGIRPVDLARLHSA